MDKLSKHLYTQRFRPEWRYLSGSFFLAEVDGESEVHGGEHGLGLARLRVANQLPQTLVHHRVEECKVVPVHLHHTNTHSSFAKGV